MKRRDLLGTSVAAGAVLAAGASICLGTPAGGGMRAGFAREVITPPLGTMMMGFGGRDYKQGCQAVHDDIHVRALFLEHENERALILAYDLCFVGREEADRFKGALGREFDLLPRQILINFSHNHVSPAVGTWYWAGYRPPDRVYVNQLERATLEAARRAKAGMREVTVSAGVGSTDLPLSRRKPDAKGEILFAPNPDGVVYKRLPVCLFQDRQGKAVCLLFSVSAHPSQISGWEISAEYPGVACRLLDKQLGTTAAMFVQGTGGDANASEVGKTDGKWRFGTWETVERSGRIVAEDVFVAMQGELTPVTPAIHTAITETHWPLQPVPPRSEFEAVVNEVKDEDCPATIRCQWAKRELRLLDLGEKLPTAASVLVQLVQIGPNLRLVAVEGELVGAWGYLIEDLFEQGVTFPLGYSNGQGLYLPVSKMIPEGGYEVVSSWEYGYPSMLAPGMEEVLLPAITRLKPQEGK